MARRYKTADDMREEYLSNPGISTDESHEDSYNKRRKELQNEYKNNLEEADLNVTSYVGEPTITNRSKKVSDFFKPEKMTKLGGDPKDYSYIPLNRPYKEEDINQPIFRPELRNNRTQKELQRANNLADRDEQINDLASKARAARLIGTDDRIDSIDTDLLDRPKYQEKNRYYKNREAFTNLRDMLNTPKNQKELDMVLPMPKSYSPYSNLNPIMKKKKPYYEDE